MHAGRRDKRVGFFPRQFEASRQRTGVIGNLLRMIAQGLRCGEHRSGVFVTRIIGPLEHGQAAAGHTPGVEASFKSADVAPVATVGGLEPLFVVAATNPFHEESDEGARSVRRRIPSCFSSLSSESAAVAAADSHFSSSIPSRTPQSLQSATRVAPGRWRSLHSPSCAGRAVAARPCASSWRAQRAT